jgi:hypothetical protein
MKPKPNSGIDARVEWIGRMADRRVQANATGDLEELERIAAEYEAHHMPMTASQVRLAISLRRKEKTQNEQYDTINQ